MIKEILLDGDGVVIAKHGYFSQRLVEEKGAPAEKVMAFFKGEFGLCTVGKSDLKDAISKYLPEWNWTGTVEDLLDYWFSGEAKTNQQVLQVVDDLRATGVKVYLASDNEKYRAEYIKKDMGLESRFDGIFFSCDLGYKKSQPEFFQAIIQTSGAEPKDFTYWDDDTENVEVARSMGLQANTYVDFDEFNQQVRQLVTY